MLYCDLYLQDDIVEKLWCLLDFDDFRVEFKWKGIYYVEKYCWSKSVKMMMEIFERLQVIDISLLL